MLPLDTASTVLPCVAEVIPMPRLAPLVVVITHVAAMVVVARIKIARVEVHLSRSLCDPWVRDQTHAAINGS